MILSACGGGGDGDSAAIEPLPAGSGLYFTNGILGADSANFYRVDAVSGNTALQSIGDGSDSAGIAQCPSIAALDLRPDGVALAVSQRTAVLLQADVRSTLCHPLATLPEVMGAVAVRADGRVFTVSATHKLYQLDAQGSVLSSQVLLCALAAPTCPVTGIDFAPDGTLYAIVSGGLWSRIDPASGQLTTVKSGIGLSDDFDIDAIGQVRGLAGGELRSIDLAGNPTGQAISVFGGTALATGVVYR
ncbi:MAG TPA: hypothetical protein VGM74_13980 [Burkholderiaceae bacterium]